MIRYISILLIALLSLTARAEVWQARYGIAETFNFKLYNADGTLDVDEVDSGTEVSLSCNEGAETTATNDFADEGTFYSIALTAAELQCERIAVVIAATTTEVFFIQTHSNASAMTPTSDSNLVNIAGSAVSASSAQLGVNIVNAAGTAWGSGAITAASIATDAIGATELAADAGTEIGTANWATTTRQLTSSQTFNLTGSITGNVSGSVGSIGTGGITEASFATAAGSFDALGIIDQGTAQAATSTTLQLRSAATFADDEIIGASCLITGGTAGVGQARTVTDYASSTDTATVAAWTTTPTGTITYQCFGTASVSGGGGASAADIWSYGDRQLTAIDEDTTTLDLNATAVGSVAGAVASVTGNVGGNVTGSVGSVASGGITAASIATGAFDADAMAADAGTEVASAVWNEDATGHQTQGSFGQAIGDPAADPDSIWGLANTNLNATVASRATQASVDAVDDFVDDLETRLGTPSNLGGGATVANNLSDIEAQTDDIGVAGAGLTAADDAVIAAIAALNNLSATQVRDLVIEDQGGGVSLGCALSVLLATPRATWSRVARARPTRTRAGPRPERQERLLATATVLLRSPARATDV